MDTQANAREQRKYVAPGLTGMSFYVPEIGTDGKPIYETITTTGQIRFVNNKPVVRESLRRFTAYPVDPKNPMNRMHSKESRMCFYILEPNDKKYNEAFKALEALADDPSCGILRLADYEKNRNPSAFEEAERRKKAEQEVEEHKKIAQEANVKAETLKTEVLKRDEEINKVKDELSEKDRQLAEAHEKMEALMKGDTSIKRRPGRPPNVPA